jgi:PAS domain-containing protein
MPIKDLLQKTDFFPEPMAVVSPDGTINACNRPFARQLSVPNEGLVGTRLDSLAALSAHAIEEYRWARLSSGSADAQAFRGEICDWYLSAQ